MLERAFDLDAQVALRPEPFGALAYHFGTRRLSFLRSPEIVAVVRALSGSGSTREALVECGIDERRWPSFVSALESLEDSGMIRCR